MSRLEPLTSPTASRHITNNANAVGLLSEDGSDINNEGVKNMINQSVIIKDEVKSGI